MKIYTLTGHDSTSINNLVEALQAADTRYAAVWTGALAAMPPEAAQPLCDFAENGGAVAAYSDSTGHRRIPLQSPAMRSDFDFGPLLVIDTNVFRLWTPSQVPLRHAGLYRLLLFLSRHGRIEHLPQQLYGDASELEDQFAYVSADRREVEQEMEQVFTEHLKLIDAWLDKAPFTETSLPHEGLAMSVVIPVKNRVRTIADAIRSALAQELPEGLTHNVIVVDNHSTDGTTETIAAIAAEDERVVHVIPSRTDLGIGGCWNVALNHPQVAPIVVQLDSDDLYIDTHTLSNIYSKFQSDDCGMVVGSYRLVDFNLNELPPGVIDHREWTPANGHNNALRVNGFGAPRAFLTRLARKIGFPDVSYGEDYSMCLAISESHHVGRLYQPLYLCRRWEGNSDANLPLERINANNAYKDSLRATALERRMEINRDGCHSFIERFFADQMTKWPMARENHDAVCAAPTKQVDYGSVVLLPARKGSTTAKVDAASVAQRPCFLCHEQRPQEQTSLPEYRYEVLANPYPIVDRHFTVAAMEHRPQVLDNDVIADMERLARRYPAYTIFFNGPTCGASAPDHLHLQMVPSELLPLWTDNRRGRHGIPQGTDINAFCRYNLAAHTVEWRWFKRRAHRPACYPHILVSPGALDLAGIIVTIRRQDFNHMDNTLTAQILSEVIDPD